MNNKYACEKCNVMYESAGFCENCGCGLQVAYDVNDMTHMDAIERLEEQIEQLGVKKVWALIERNYTNPYIRSRVRSLFFSAMYKMKISLDHLFKE